MAGWLGKPVEKYDYGTTGGSWTRQPALIVIHSTEGTGWTNYQNGSVAPHFTIEPKSGEIHQHVSLAYAARALAHPSGTPETNRAGAIQIETIGTCDPNNKGKGSWNYLPDMDSQQCANIAALLQMIHGAIPAIPLTRSVEFEPYPDPGYGDGHPRMSNSTWSSYKGVCGHQHVPSNSHGDPGDIPIDEILNGTSNGGDFDMMGVVQVDKEAPEFLYTGTLLVWIQNTDQRSRLLGEYKKQTGRDIIYTTISAKDPIEAGYYGFLPFNAPAPGGWDWSKHRKTYTA